MGVHPGGRRILDVVGQSLGIGEELWASRQVLREHGNTSSSAVLLTLERLLAERRPSSGQHVVCLAFGPGLTVCAVLLRGR
jgi:predicted naringenin-chalcone synthase